MSELVLTYKQDDPYNHTGFMTVTVRTGDFAGSARAYVAESWISRFAGQLEQYPLGEHGAGLTATDVSISVLPYGSTGHLRVVAELRSGDGVAITQSAVLQIESDYAALATFRDALTALLGGTRTDAVLTGHR